jgi:HD-like signal output (HDOD) protein
MDAFTAGIVHEIGRMVIARGMPSRCAQIVKEARARKVSEAIVEKEMLGVTHAEIGAYLLGVWGLPFSIVEAVAFHHEPPKQNVPASLGVALQIADAVIDGAPVAFAG